jgi:hypothetical protein
VAAQAQAPRFTQGGSFRYTVGGAEGNTLETLGSTHFDPAKETNGYEGTILGTARNGSRLVAGEGDIRPTTRFTIGGIELDAISAAKSGFLISNLDGSFSVPNTGRTKAATQAAPSEAAPAQEEEVESAAYGRTEAAIKALELVNTFTGGDSVTDQVVGKSMAYVLDGDMENAARVLTQATGLDPEAATATIAHTFETLRHSAATVMERYHGFKNGGEVFDFIAENATPQVRSSLALRMYHGEKAAFAEAAQIYRKAHR